MSGRSGNLFRRAQDKCAFQPALQVFAGGDRRELLPPIEKQGRRPCRNTHFAGRGRSPEVQGTVRERSELLSLIPRHSLLMLTNGYDRWRRLQILRLKRRRRRFDSCLEREFKSSSWPGHLICNRLFPGPIFMLYWLAMRPKKVTRAGGVGNGYFGRVGRGFDPRPERKFR